MSCEPELLKIEDMQPIARKLDLPEGIPPLTSLYMYIAGSCNLACHHCWISPTFEPDNSKGQFLKLEFIKKSVREAKLLGLGSVKLTGGEPMLHPQFREIIDYLNSEGVDILVETNGTLINDETAKFLKSKPHFKFVSVSVDGAKSETHDKLRGIDGAFNQATSGIKSLVKAGFHPQLICTLHKGNIAELEEVIALAESHGCGSIKFNHIQQMGRGDDFNKNDVLSVKELIEIFETIENGLISKFKISIFFDIPFAFHSIRKLLKNPIKRCNVLNLLGVLSGGQVSLCGIGVTIPELIYGDISSDNIHQIWTSSPELARLRKMIPESLTGICGNCLHKEMCLGQCVANNYHISGILNAPYFFCKIADELGLFPKTRKIII